MIPVGISCSNHQTSRKSADSVGNGSNNQSPLTCISTAQLRESKKNAIAIVPWIAHSSLNPTTRSTYVRQDQIGLSGMLSSVLIRTHLM